MVCCVVLCLPFVYLRELGYFSASMGCCLFLLRLLFIRWFVGVVALMFLLLVLLWSRSSCEGEIRAQNGASKDGGMTW